MAIDGRRMRNGRSLRGSRAGTLSIAAGCALLVALGGTSPTARGEDPGAPRGGAPAMDGNPAPAPPAGGEDGDADLQERIGRAIEKGVAWLRAKQPSDGCWGTRITGPQAYDGSTDMYTYPSGLTALAVYTLLKCKAPPEDDAVVRGLGWLQRNHRIPGTSYETSMTLLAVTATADPDKKAKDSRAAGDRVKLTTENRTWALELKDGLLARRAPDAWRYCGKGDSMPGGDQDLSSTQLAVLALFAADRCGIRVDGRVWAGVVRWALTLQQKDGPAMERAVGADAAGRAPSGPPSRYAPPSPPASYRARGFVYTLDPAGVSTARERTPTGSMTACGVGTLVTARYVLQSHADAAWKSLDAKAIDQSIQDGLAWLDLYWHPSENPPHDVGIYHVYYLYCVERAMDLLGAPRLGKRCWYAEMARALVAKQKDDGSFDTKSSHWPSAYLDTCFALLFLERATRGAIPVPVVTGDPAAPPGPGK